MRIDELQVAAFGRFLGRRISLGPGLNVIYGLNEAGKSTLERFVLGMLYGFQKRGQKRSYTDDAYRYRPWNGAGYRGAMIYTLDDGRVFRVEREFEPNRDGVRIYDHLTGADLTGRFEADRRKELLYAEKHLGLSEEAFRATARVGQLAVGQLEGAGELVARVANAKESGREDLSVRDALARLEERRGAIGTERAAGKPYGRVARALADRRAALEEALGARERMRDWEAGLAEAQAVIAELDEELASARQRLGWAELAEAEGRLERAVAAARSVRELRATAAQWERYAAVPVEQLSRLRRLQAEAAEAGERAEAWRSRAGALESELAAARPAEAPAVVVKHTPAGYLAMAVAAAGVLGLIAGLAVGNTAVLAVSSVLAVAGGAGWFLVARRVAAAEREQLRLQAQAVARRDAQAGEISFQVQEAQRRAEAEGARAQVAAAEARAILAAAGAADAAAFEEACAHREARDRALAEAAALEGALGALQGGGESPEALAARVEQFRSTLHGAPPPDLKPAQSLRDDLRRLEHRRAELAVRESELSARIDTALHEVQDTAELRRELDALTEEKERLDFELSAIALAAETIADVAGQVHREFAPRLNRALGQTAAALTGGRYNSVQVDEQACLRVITEDGRTVETSSLSGGAVDQLYLSFRLALLDLITEGKERVPLLLDDPFVQYDDRRAAAAMAALAAAARDRQVILMTCHRREVELAGARAHHIELTDAAAEENA